MKNELDIASSIANEKLDVVIVDDTPDNLRFLVGILQESGYRVRPAPSGEYALTTSMKEPPALILLDIMMPDMDGYEVCKRLKADELTKDIPIIFLSALNEVFDKVKAFKVGGLDYIAKPFQVDEVLARVKTHLKIHSQQKSLALQNEELIKMNTKITEQAAKLEYLARTDFLTGLSNRRDFQELVQKEEKRFWRTKKPFSFILLDIDHFKGVNDTYGHDCGDVVLVGVSRSLEKALRGQDVVARWGGEEFICLLPETEIEGARRVAEKIRESVAGVTHKCDTYEIAVTVTLGLSDFGGDCSVEECISQADSALYIGKKEGRNQVAVSA